jgi:hypothetical protein
MAQLVLDFCQFSKLFVLCACTVCLYYKVIKGSYLLPRGVGAVHIRGLHLTQRVPRLNPGITSPA